MLYFGIVKKGIIETEVLGTSAHGTTVLIKIVGENPKGWVIYEEGVTYGCVGGAGVMNVNGTEIRLNRDAIVDIPPLTPYHDRSDSQSITDPLLLVSTRKHEFDPHKERSLGMDFVKWE